MSIWQRQSSGNEQIISSSQAIASAENNRKYYTTSQLALRWGVSAVTVIRLIEQGDLNGLKIRGSYRISKCSIKNYETKVAF
ncbi:hypothetical protein MNBD_NITROSPINAE04-425 [hydrothermal vent metagenome]|uniref:Helix-turn-helix domain-containing protein n=1 Tax=hydrothermal vent metagenome TaxID=652676 RepID=A0A3B1CRI2_9ZZZZ